MYGAKDSRRRNENESELLEFLADPTVNVLEVDDAASRVYAEMVVALRKAGAPLPTNDVWIAAVAAREGASVLTYDEHFEAITRVAARLLAL
ncbi:MAG: PIN domain-containing protein [Deltaproteobacteria bacterium]|nr:PIN domain-containing protein [Deltaproteobacteria bacterium]